MDPTSTIKTPKKQTWRDLVVFSTKKWQKAEATQAWVWPAAGAMTSVARDLVCLRSSVVQDVSRSAGRHVQSRSSRCPNIGGAVAAPYSTQHRCDRQIFHVFISFVKQDCRALTCKNTGHRISRILLKSNTCHPQPDLNPAQPGNASHILGVLRSYLYITVGKQLSLF